MIFPIQFCTSVFLVFIPFIILYKTSRFQARIKFFVSLNRPDNEVIDKTSGYRNSQNENGNTGKFFIGIFQRIKKCSSPKIKIWFAPMFFSGLFCGFERCGSAIILIQFPTWCPRRESNPHCWLRRPVLYPLSYGGKFYLVSTLKIPKTLPIGKVFGNDLGF